MGLSLYNVRLFYAMHNDIKSVKTVKSSSIVGTVMDKYHPHGDSSIYMTNETID